MKFSTGAGSEDSKNFIRLKDGESVRGVFRGDIHEFHTHWSGTRTQVCTGPGCVLCKENPSVKPAFRFRLNLVVKDGEGYAAKIFENGWKVYQQLREINDEVPLESILVKIGRTGSGKNDTSYTVIAVPNGTVNADLEAKLKQVQLLDLRPAAEGKEVSDSAEPAMVTEEDITF